MSGARGFGTTSGVGTTDCVVLANTTHYDAGVTYCFWAQRNSLGGGNLGRVFQKSTTGDTLPNMANLLVTGTYYLRYRHPWTTVGEFQITLSASAADTGSWYCWTYDASSVANVPRVWRDGAEVAVTTFTTPIGSLTSTTEAWTLGNRKSDGIRNWDGQIGPFAMWRRMLSPAEAQWASMGYSGLWFPEGLVVNVDTALTVDSRNPGPVITGTKPTHGPLVIYPPRSLLRLAAL